MANLPQFASKVLQKLILVIRCAAIFVQLGGLSRAHGAQITLSPAGAIYYAVRGHRAGWSHRWFRWACDVEAEGIQIRVGRLLLGRIGDSFF